jgi:short-subunit dehydrogenase
MTTTDPAGQQRRLRPLGAAGRLDSQHRLDPRLQPSPLYASYSAAKSFVLNFTEALSYELRGSGVVAIALSPGIVATEFSRSRASWPPATSVWSNRLLPRRVSAALAHRLMT